MLRRRLIWMCSKTDGFHLGGSTTFKAHIFLILIHSSDTRSAGPCGSSFQNFTLKRNVFLGFDLLSFKYRRLCKLSATFTLHVTFQMLYSRGYLARDACRMLSTSPPLSHAPSSALFAQPGPRELPLHGMTSPDSSPGLALHTVISSNSVRFEIICPHLSCSVLTNCSPNLWATQAAPCL